MTVVTFGRVWGDPEITDQKELLMLLSMADNGSDDDGYFIPNLERCARDARIPMDEAEAIFNDLIRRRIILATREESPTGERMYRILTTAEVLS